jgi:archaeal preflagellin peptidase FlaK
MLPWNTITRRQGNKKIIEELFMIINIPLIGAIIAILACLYASYSDLKHGIIPNKLTFPLIGIGIILNGFYALQTGNLWIIIGCLIITGVIFVLGYLFWKLGAWAGGDVKLFTALAALLPFYPALISYNIFQVPFPVESTYPFPLTLIINSILSMLPFLLIYVFYVAVKNKPHLVGELLSPVKEYRKNLVLTLVITSAVTLTYFITKQLNYQVIIVSLIMIYLLSLLISKFPNRVKAVLISVVTVFALFSNFQVTISSIIILFISIVLIEMVRKLLTTVSKQALQDDYPVSNLKEGMIPAYKLYLTDNEIFVDDKSFFQKIKKAIKTADLSLVTAPKGKLVVGSLAAGLTKEDIELLQKLAKEGKISNEFRVKKGIPFAPSILIGLIISLFVGDLAIILLKIIYGIMY